jgi:hypothetical protein
VYFLIEEATRSTSYAPSIKPYQRTRDGRGAWLAILRQFAGEAKWRAEIKIAEELLLNRKWKGQDNFPFEKFVSQHRAAYVSMQECAEHVPHQLPHEITRVTYLLNAIESHHAPLQAAMANVRLDDGVNGKMNDFELASSYLLPHDPVAAKRSVQTRGGRQANVSDTTANTHSMKVGIGKTGVELRYHTTPDYQQLTSEQKAELNAHRDTLEQAGKGRNLPGGPAPKGRQNGKRRRDPSPKKSKHFQALVAQAVAKQLTDTKTAADADQAAEDTLKSYIASVISSAQGQLDAQGRLIPTQRTVASVTLDEPPSVPSPASLVSLNSILKRAKKN